MVEQVQITQVTKQGPVVVHPESSADIIFLKNKNSVEQELEETLVDYQGKKHTYLSERINEDIGLIYNDISQMSLMSFEGGFAKGTAKGLTRDMTIKGNTLQNISGYLSGDYPLQNGDGSQQRVFKPFSNCLKSNIEYTIVLSLKDVSTNPVARILVTLAGDIMINGSFESTKKGINITKITAPNNVKPNDSNIRIQLTDIQSGHRATVEWCMILEGDWTNKQIPQYFQGICSVGEDHNQIEVKSNGKNLFNKNNPDHVLKNMFIESNGNINTVSGTLSVKVPVKENTTYSVQGNYNRSIARYETVDGIYISHESKSGTFTTPKNCNYIVWYIGNEQIENKNVDFVQIEEANSKTPYEPYIEDKKKIMLDAPLRSLPNGIRDEIINGKLYRRVGTYRITGNENWIYEPTYTNDTLYGCYVLNKGELFPKCKTNSRFYSNNYPDNSGHILKHGFACNGATVSLRLGKNEFTDHSLNGFKNVLKANSTIFYYELEEPIITDLSKDLNVKTYNSITHITNINTLIKANLFFKAPADIPVLIGELQRENMELKEQIIEHNEVMKLVKMQLGSIAAIQQENI